MILSVFSPVLGAFGLEESLKYLSELKVDAIELGCGGYPGTRHADAKVLVKNKSELNKLKELLEKYSIKISALSVHGNGIHPQKALADSFNADYEAACELSGLLGVDRLITFSGCPGDGKGDYPNWVTCPWPNEYSELLEWQWNEKLIPYWEKAVKTAVNGGVKYIGLELHPGFMVYNPQTLLRLREVSPVIGANLDPSHLIWQGIDIVEAIRSLKGALHFFHAKDTEMLSSSKVNGVLDTKPYTDEFNRSWIFRTVGYGSDTLFWKKVISALKTVGYDYAVSIEHEDSLMSPKEGLEKAVKFMQDVLIYKGGAEVWWA